VAAVDGQGWVWHIRITRTDGTVRDRPCPAGVDAVALARITSGMRGVARVELFGTDGQTAEVAAFAGGEMRP
jgi:hypothetical protein